MENLASLIAAGRILDKLLEGEEVKSTNAIWVIFAPLIHRQR